MDAPAEALAEVPDRALMFSEDAAQRNHPQAHHLIAQLARDGVELAIRHIEIAGDRPEDALHATELFGEIVHAALCVADRARAASRSESGWIGGAEPTGKRAISRELGADGQKGRVRAP